ncbi:MAG: hypothetical protein DRO99_05120 [Candidatus Aenigmatarchaeota archaeon]|nr:MAG: hypothetical protein DRO99_05120 [Candidatus Aenigmarchaeota archaeon]
MADEIDLVDAGCCFRGHTVYVPLELSTDPSKWRGNLFYFSGGIPRKLPKKYEELAIKNAFCFEELTELEREENEVLRRRAGQPG